MKKALSLILTLTLLISVLSVFPAFASNEIAISTKEQFFTFTVYHSGRPLVHSPASFYNLVAASIDAGPAAVIQYRQIP